MPLVRSVPPAIVASLDALDGLWGHRVRYVARDAKDRLGLSALLVRADGFVAWASDTTPRLKDVTLAAAKWFTAGEGSRGGKVDTATQIFS